MAPVSEAEGQRSGGRWAHRCRRDVLDVLGRVLLHRLRLTAGRGAKQGIVVTVAHGSVVRRPLELNASSNASVGKLRKHSCSALGAGKQQRLAAGGSRGAHVARLASAGARGRSMEKNTQTSSLHRKSNPLVHSGFSSGEG